MSRIMMVTPSCNIEDRFYVEGTDNRFYFDVISFKRGLALVKYPEDVTFDDLIIYTTGILNKKSNFKIEMFRAFGFPTQNDNAKKSRLARNTSKIELEFFGIQFVYKGFTISVPYGARDIDVLEAINQTVCESILELNRYKLFAQSSMADISRMSLNIPDEFNRFKWEKLLNNATKSSNKTDAITFADFYGRIVQHILIADGNISLDNALTKAYCTISAISNEVNYTIIKDGVDVLCDVNWVYARELREWFEKNMM